MNTRLTPRPAVTAMRPYSPPTGSRSERLRLDFNENTVGCSPRVVEFLRRGLEQNGLATYPDPQAGAASLAPFFGASPSQTLLTNGTDEAIQLVVNTFVDPGDRVVTLKPTYAMYRFYSEVMGAHVVEVEHVGATFSFPLEGLIEAGRGARAVFIANPNNPTGTVASLDQIERVLTALPAVAVVVDEAYFEFCGLTTVPWIDRFPNLLVSRTFSKAYGLAGLRCGLLFSQEANIVAMKTVQSPYSVNTVAVMAATEAVQDREFLDGYVRTVTSQRERLTGVMRRLGLRYLESAGNFVLFWPKDAGRLHRACLEAGVLLRDRSQDFPGAVRVTVGVESQTDTFVQILEAQCRA